MLTIRNRGNEALNGVLIQIELLDQEGNLLSGVQAATESGSPPGGVELEQLKPLTSYEWERKVAAHSWKPPLPRGQEAQPLPRGQESWIGLGPYMLLPSCPVAAKLSLFALQDDEYNWYRVSTVVLREPASPTMFRTGYEEDEVSCLRTQLAHFGDVAVHIRVEETGEIITLSTFPRLSLDQMAALDKFLGVRKFAPAISEQGLVQQELSLLFRFSKERFDAPVPELPEQFARVPLIVVGVSARDIHSRVPDL